MSFRRPRSSRASDGLGEVNAAANEKAYMESARTPGPSALEPIAPADVLMESLLEKLKLLRYEAEFCQRKHTRMKPLTRGYFALPAPLNSQNEQFYYFTSLVAWLLTLAGRRFQAPQQFDDPNITCTAILAELRELGFGPPAWPATKLRQGHGEAVCTVVNCLADMALSRQGWAWKPPLHPPETQMEEADVDDDAEVLGNEITDEVTAGYSSGEEAYLNHMPGEPSVTGRGGHDREHESAPGPETKVDPAEWQLEVERVGPKLTSSLSADAKDWRTHLEQAQQHSKAIAQLWPDGQAMLGRVQMEVASALDKLSARERYLNNQFEGLTAEYRDAHEQLSRLQGLYHQKQSTLAALDNELAQVSKGLEEAKAELAERGSSISDTSPVTRIKAAIASLKGELQQMLVRIGVLQHQLLQLSLRTRRQAGTQGQAAMPQH